MSSSALLCIVVPSFSIVGVPASLDAAYCSIVDGFLRNPFDLGLSYVEADDPETSDGVLIVVGGYRTLLCRGIG